MGSNQDDDIEDVCIEEVSSKNIHSGKAVVAPDADNVSPVTGCVILLVIVSLLYYGGCHVVTYFTGGRLGATTSIHEIQLDKRSFLGKTITVEGVMADIEDEFGFNRIKIELMTSVLSNFFANAEFLDALIIDENLKGRFRATKTRGGDNIILKGEIRMYNNSFTIYMNVEDFEY